MQSAMCWWHGACCRQRVLQWGWGGSALTWPALAGCGAMHLGCHPLTAPRPPCPLLQIYYIEFYADNCRACKRVAKDWSAIADAMAARDQGLVIARINCEENEQRCTRVGGGGAVLLLVLMLGRQLLTGRLAGWLMYLQWMAACLRAWAGARPPVSAMHPLGLSPGCPGPAAGHRVHPHVQGVPPRRGHLHLHSRCARLGGGGGRMTALGPPAPPTHCRRQCGRPPFKPPAAATAPHPTNQAPCARPHARCRHLSQGHDGALCHQVCRGAAAAGPGAPRRRQRVIGRGRQPARQQRRAPQQQQQQHTLTHNSPSASPTMRPFISRHRLHRPPPALPHPRTLQRQPAGPRPPSPSATDWLPAPLVTRPLPSVPPPPRA